MLYEHVFRVILKCIFLDFAQNYQLKTKIQKYSSGLFWSQWWLCVEVVCLGLQALNTVSKYHYITIIAMYTVNGHKLIKVEIQSICKFTDINTDKII